MRKFAFIFAVLLFTMNSCDSVMFTTSQPEDAVILKQFPKKMRGTFVNLDQDTLLIESTSFLYDGGDRITLSKDVSSPVSILKKMDTWYFINIKKEGKEEWTVYPFKISGKDRITVYFSTMEVEEQKLIEDFRSKMHVQKFTYKYGEYYLIAPSKRQFKKLLKKGLFSEKMVFERIK